MAAKSKAPKKESDYPNIIEEPIRVVGDQTRRKSEGGTAKKKPLKRSRKTVAKKSRKK
jgi:hypothetical protein